MSLLEMAVLDQLDQIPEVPWFHGDDQCDCTFQRIGMWSNPYIGRTLEVRLCCIWGKIYDQYPEFVREIPASFNQNTKQYDRESIAWNAEDADMPRYLWVRQAARITGVPVAEVRNILADKQPPSRVPEGTGIRVTEETNEQ